MGKDNITGDEDPALREGAGGPDFRVLLDFSLGRIDCGSAIAALGMGGEEDLFLLMARARLPMPRLPDTAIRGMVDELNGLHAGVVSQLGSRIARRAGQLAGVY